MCLIPANFISIPTAHMNYGKANERPQADRNIAKVGLPKLDPVFGDTGPLIRLWHN